MFTKTAASAFGAGSQKSKKNQFVRPIRRVTKFGSLAFPPDVDVAAVDVEIYADDGTSLLLKAVPSDEVDIVVNPRRIRNKSDWDAFEAKKFTKFRLFLADIFQDAVDRYKAFAKAPTNTQCMALFGVALRPTTRRPAFNDVTERNERNKETSQLRALRRWKLITEESSKDNEDDFVPCSKFYRYFRILVTGRNSNASTYDCGLALAGFELFGTLEAQSFETVATKFTPRVVKSQCAFSSTWVDAKAGYSVFDESPDGISANTPLPRHTTMRVGPLSATNAPHPFVLDTRCYVQNSTRDNIFRLMQGTWCSTTFSCFHQHVHCIPH